ncbi:MAG: DUF4258 domain-containing protein [Bacteroidia bacterium]
MAGSIRRRYRGWLQAGILLLIVVFALFKFTGIGQGGSACEFPARQDVSELRYVDHALCRMRCRDIDQKLVEDVYLHGEVNCKKSSMSNGNRRYALELRDSRKDMIRVIVEDDNGEHVIITVIRLDKPDKCTCS